ncbi:hypothetical protein GCM10012284_32510 [Mangrovihabitans endophyticus]|uniref:Peptidase S8/S53 domain-containing protein n=2 Tax=Mangrovihabitans endophyticus TaxID=1751298 RepID=A0A8J3FNT1_9ACTN|nr:hypothetical protein GCM10012284_32510 [Mangrovihabitans endophyticus]
MATAATGVTATAAQAAPNAEQLYYTVAPAYQGAPENLWEVAARFLGDADRAGEILDLNSGRVQPDGGRLADPGRLHEGWHLVLPWDAVGNALHDGPLPAAGEVSSDCARDAEVPAAASWGQDLLGPSRAWSVTDGSGVKVAVVGSGVDGTAPGLAGRVMAGVDVASGTGRGDTGCAGPGTALAGIIAGDDGAGGKTFGVAPGSRIVPVKVGSDDESPDNLAATGVDVAVAAGASVILLGADPTDSEMRAAVNDAVSRDVVVVLPASAGAAPGDGLLRVGEVAENGRAADDYPSDAVDVLAPGVGIATVGGTGSGAEYAAAFVAGTAALVRAAHPELHAAEAARQVLATTAREVVNPVAAVTTPLPAGVGANASSATPSNGLGTLSRVLLWAAAAMVLLLLVVFLRQPVTQSAARLVSHRRARRQARAARAGMAGDDDPFWDRPANPGVPANPGIRATRDEADEVTEEISGW